MEVPYARIQRTAFLQSEGTGFFFLRYAAMRGRMVQPRQTGCDLPDFSRSSHYRAISEELGEFMEKVITLPDKQLFLPREVAELLRYDLRTIQNWCKDGTLKAVKLFNGDYRVPRKAVLEFIEGQIE